jgi:SOS-response transcriptional repressor LexA
LDNRFSQGTLLIIDHQKTPKNLSYVVVQEAGSSIASLKRFILDGNTPYLKSIDPSFPSIKYDPLTFKIIGVVVQSIFDFE